MMPQGSSYAHLRESEVATQPHNRTKLVFVGGLHRSGTSIIQKCLADHSMVSGLSDTGVPEDEGQHLQDVLPIAAMHGGPGLFGFHPHMYLDSSSPLATLETGERLLAAWSPYWDATRPVLLEKSPPNILRTTFLQHVFPSAHFVIVLRDPVAVAYATQKWTSRLPWLRSLGIPDRRQPKAWIHTLIEHWLRCHESFQRDSARLRRVAVIRYESFVADPERVLAQLHDFLAIPREPLVRKVRSGVNAEYWEKWSRRRRSLVTRGYAESVVRDFEERVGLFGYSLVRMTYSEGQNLL